jgi:hypothetical protein
LYIAKSEGAKFWLSAIKTLGVEKSITACDNGFNCLGEGIFFLKQSLKAMQ